ncbi:DNA ligase 1-like [Physella acuta]|uniref:DNA ligase 1-like n=1 Tax=Physella acuta TaxID=109671 RepID=UPI0027DCB70B|nr:DNA ligase 1-like [Physella acuta]
MKSHCLLVLAAILVTFSVLVRAQNDRRAEIAEKEALARDDYMKRERGIEEMKEYEYRQMVDDRKKEIENERARKEKVIRERYRQDEDEMLHEHLDNEKKVKEERDKKEKDAQEYEKAMEEINYLKADQERKMQEFYDQYNKDKKDIEDKIKLEQADAAKKTKEADKKKSKVKIAALEEKKKAMMKKMDEKEKEMREQYAASERKAQEAYEQREQKLREKKEQEERDKYEKQEKKSYQRKETEIEELERRVKQLKVIAEKLNKNVCRGGYSTGQVCKLSDSASNLFKCITDSSYRKRQASEPAMFEEMVTRPAVAVAASGMNFLLGADFDLMAEDVTRNSLTLQTVSENFLAPLSVSSSFFSCPLPYDFKPDYSYGRYQDDEPVPQYGYAKPA